jgi:hypothetical protein
VCCTLCHGCQFRPADNALDRCLGVGVGPPCRSPRGRALVVPGVCVRGDGRGSAQEPREIRVRVGGRPSAFLCPAGSRLSAGSRRRAALQISVRLGPLSALPPAQGPGSAAAAVTHGSFSELLWRCPSGARVRLARKPCAHAREVSNVLDNFESTPPPP